jgi:hypothetical protein
MRFEHSVVLGWTWFGIGRVRLLPTETIQYTIWLVFLTNNFAVGIHYNLPGDTKKCIRTNSAS